MLSVICCCSEKTSIKIKTTLTNIIQELHKQWFYKNAQQNKLVSLSAKHVSNFLLIWNKKAFFFSVQLLEYCRVWITNVEMHIWCMKTDFVFQTSVETRRDKTNWNMQTGKSQAAVNPLTSTLLVLIKTRCRENDWREERNTSQTHMHTHTHRTCTHPSETQPPTETSREPTHAETKTVNEKLKRWSSEIFWSYSTTETHKFEHKTESWVKIPPNSAPSEQLS